MQLPIMGSPEETLELVKFLSTKVNGCSVEDARLVVDKKLLDPRKISAYIAWGFIIKEADKIKLTERGRLLVKNEGKEELSEVFCEVINDIEAYRSMVERLYYNKTQMVITNVEVATFWFESKKFDMTNDNENTLKDRAVCFFKVCDSAELGKFYLGRRGQPTRLEVNKEAIAAFIEGGKGEKENITSENNEISQNDVFDSENIEEKVNNKRKNKSEDDLVPLIISFIDGRKAVLQMPSGASKEDAKYVFDMINLMLPRQYGLDKE